MSPIENNEPRSERSKKIEALEKKVGGQLPNDYKAFLLNPKTYPLIGRVLDFVGVDKKRESTSIPRFLGVGDDPIDNLEMTYSYYVAAGRIPRDTVPIAEDIAGNLICIGVFGRSKGNVFFWDHEFENDREGYDNLAIVARSFTQFVDLLQPEK
jgi:hypothetical protein